MPIDSKHPLYAEKLADWQQLRHCYAGERVIKENGTTYLPATSGMEEDGMTQNGKGLKAYNAYKMRAVFPDFVKDAVEAMVGLIHREPAVIELPDQMKDMMDYATQEGDGLQALLRKITEAQILKGRFGLLLDVQDGVDISKALPFISTYDAESIINWNQLNRQVTTVVLDECGYEQNAQLEWNLVKRYRILALGTALGTDSKLTGYVTAEVVNDTALPPTSAYKQPSIGGKKLEEIPFIFVNAADLLPTPDEPPLLGLSNLALAVYRGEADYRLGLFMQSQETLVIVGDEATGADGKPKETRVGAGAKISLNENGEAYYVGIKAEGLKEQASALEKDKNQAANKAAQLLDNVSGDQASGEALRVRVAAQTASLTQVAVTGAEALEQILKIAAEWMGADPEKVTVTPNLDFADDPMTGRDLLELMQAKQLGAPLSRESIHRLMKKRDITVLSFEEEEDAIASEEPTGTTGLGVDGSLTGEDKKGKTDANNGKSGAA